jgi:LysM repeat protein
VQTESQLLKYILLALEGNEYNPKVPTKDGKVIGQSGITIGKGFDLGAQDEARLKKMGIPEPIVKKIVSSGYLGLKGEDAVNALNKGTLKLSAEEVDEINSLTIPFYKNEFEAALKKQTGLDAQKDLTLNQRIALTSAYFNLGNGLFYKNVETEEGTTKKVKTNLSRQLANKDWTAVTNNLATWSSKAPIGLQARRMSEAALFAGDVGPEDLVKYKDQVVSSLQGNEESDKTAYDSYTIQKGDTLTSIAEKTGKPVYEIADRNNITNPNQIQVGQSLLL